MALLDNLEVKATGDVNDALSKIDQLIAKIEGINSVKRTVNIAASIGNSTQQIKSVQESIAKLNDTISSSSKRLNNFDFSKMQFPESSFLSVTHMANAYTELEFAARQAYAAMEAAHSIGSLAIPENITKLSEAIDNLSGKVGTMKTEVAKNARAAQKEIDNSAKGSADSVKNNVGIIGGKLQSLFASIKRIAFYRVIRSAIKAVTQGFQEGIKNAYLWAVENNHAFQQVMDTYATKGLYLKNTLGALASTVLTALLPAVVSVVDAFVWGANAVNEFIAAITGQNKYLKAKEVVTVFAESVDDATKKQKELNQQLMAFDELNVITTPRDRGRGSDDELEKIDPFEEVEVSEGMQSIADAIKEALPIIGTVIQENLPAILAGIGAAAMFTKFFGSAITAGITNALFGGSGEAGVQNTINRLMNNKAFTIAIGLGAMILSYFLSDSAGKALAMGDVYKGVAEGVGGAIAGAVGGKLLLGSVVGGPLGIIAGVVFSVAVTLRAYTDKIIQDDPEAAAQDLLNKTPNAINANLHTPWESTKPLVTALTNKTKTLPVAKSETGYAMQAYLDEEFNQAPIIKKYAGGGFPEMGSIFAAGESGVEFVGNINGRTGVASDQEITGIADAVYATGNEEASLLRELVAVVKAGGGSMQPSAAFGRFASQSIRLYKGVTG